MHTALRYVRITAAEDDNPPTGSVPSITPLIPLLNSYFLERATIAALRKFKLLIAL